MGQAHNTRPEPADLWHSQKSLTTNIVAIIIEAIIRLLYRYICLRAKVIISVLNHLKLIIVYITQYMVWRRDSY